MKAFLHSPEGLVSAAAESHDDTSKFRLGTGGGLSLGWPGKKRADIAPVLRRPLHDPASRIAWVVVIGVLPLAGMLAYLLAAVFANITG